MGRAMVPWSPTRLPMHGPGSKLSDELLAGMSDEVEAALTDVLGVGPWTAHGFLLIALNRSDVFLQAT
jgi:3-methyladenine DNA glycosylase/8-oxoguanine DNA glycosylase